MRCTFFLPLLIVWLSFASTEMLGQNSVQAIAKRIVNPQPTKPQTASESSPPPQATDQKDQRKLDAMTIDQMMAHFGVPAVSVATIRDSKLHWVAAFGLADKKSKRAVDPETLFQAASISKPVNAMAVLRAAQEGKFSIDDDINHLLRSWKLPDDGYLENRAVTPRMLASHTAGLGDGFGFPGYKPDATLPSLIQILNGQAPSTQGPVRLVREPLTAYQYSGGGVTILQLMLTDVLNLPYHQILEHSVLSPIGMNHSHFEQPLSPQRDQNAARAHSFSGRAMKAKWRAHPELAAAGLWTTPTDLAKFAIEVQLSFKGEANHVLNQAMVREMLRPVGVGPFGIGFMLSQHETGQYFSHGGRNWGFCSLLRAHRDQGYGFAVMTNSMRGNLLVEQLERRIENAYQYDGQTP